MYGLVHVVIHYLLIACFFRKEYVKNVLMKDVAGVWAHLNDLIDARQQIASPISIPNIR